MQAVLKIKFSSVMQQENIIYFLTVVGFVLSKFKNTCKLKALHHYLKVKSNLSLMALKDLLQIWTKNV